jgi:hypothetical protein
MVDEMELERVLVLNLREEEDEEDEEDEEEDWDDDDEDDEDDEEELKAREGLPRGGSRTSRE